MRYSALAYSVEKGSVDMPRSSACCRVFSVPTDDATVPHAQPAQPAHFVALSSPPPLAQVVGRVAWVETCLSLAFTALLSASCTTPRLQVQNTWETTLHRTDARTAPNPTTGTTKKANAPEATSGNASGNTSESASSQVWQDDTQMDPAFRTTQISGSDDADFIPDLRDGGVPIPIQHLPTLQLVAAVHQFLQVRSMTTDTQTAYNTFGGGTTIVDDQARFVMLQSAWDSYLEQLEVICADAGEWPARSADPLWYAARTLQTAWRDDEKSGRAGSLNLDLASRVESIGELVQQEALEAQGLLGVDDGRTFTLEMYGLGGALQAPLQNLVVTSGFGTRIDPIHGQHSFHSGVDFSAPTGTPVYAAGTGVVTFAGYNGSAGNCVVVNHREGYATLYMHLSSIDVKKGTSLSAGSLLGKVGSTGRSTGPHLHFAVRSNGGQGSYLDPLSLLGDGGPVKFVIKEGPSDDGLLDDNSLNIGTDGYHPPINDE